MTNPNRVTGIRIGKNQLTLLGLITLIVLAIAIIGGILAAVLNYTGGDKPTPFADETPEPGLSAGLEDGATAVPTAIPTPTPTPAPVMRSATIRSLGEIAMQQNLLYSVVDGNDYNFSEMFTEIASIMGDADYTVGDVEGSMGGIATTSGSAKLVTPVSLIDVLADCGVDMLTVANDHALDGGVEDQQASLRNLADAGIEYIGGATSAEEKATPKIVEINGINVGFLAYTDNLNGNERTVPASYAFCVNYITRSTDPDADVKALRNAGADVVIAYCSWGEMLNRHFTDSQKTIANALVKAGVDVIIGYNPHVIQTAAWAENTGADGNVHRTLVVGATGNLLSDQRGQYADSGVIFQFTIQEVEEGRFAITSPTYIPTYVWRSGVEGETNRYSYRVLPVGLWLDETPEGMSDEDAARMRQVWEEAQAIIPADVAAVAAQ